MSAENGKQNGRTSLDDRVRVALVGVGNCANSLLQGVEYYKDAPDDQFVPGLMHVNVGGYHVREIEFTAAFDVTTDKVGKDLPDAIWAHPNDTYKFADVQRITDAARKRGIPITTITETLTPASSSFESWQSRQFEALAAALHQATHR